MLQIIRDHFYEFLAGDLNFVRHYRPCAFLSDEGEQIMWLALITLRDVSQSNDMLNRYRYDGQRETRTTFPQNIAPARRAPLNAHDAAARADCPQKFLTSCRFPLKTSPRHRAR